MTMSGPPLIFYRTCHWPTETIFLGDILSYLGPLDRPPLSAGLKTKSLSSKSSERAFFSPTDRLLVTRKGCSMTLKTSCSTSLQKVLIEAFCTLGQKVLLGLKLVEAPVDTGLLAKKCFNLIWRKHLNRSTFRPKELTPLLLGTKDKPLDSKDN